MCYKTGQIINSLHRIIFKLTGYRYRDILYIREEKFLYYKKAKLFIEATAVSAEARCIKSFVADYNRNFKNRHQVERYTCDGFYLYINQR